MKSNIIHLPHRPEGFERRGITITDDASNVAALFAAPEESGSAEHAALSDPMQQLGEEELEIARLRSMRVDDIVAEYLGVRDQLDEARHEFQAIEKRLKDSLAMKSMALREKADFLGVDNFNIRGLATAYRNSKVSYRVADWEAFSSWIIDTKNTQCLEKRVAKLATVEIEKDLGATPPGVEKITEVEFLVRRSKG